jgi:hypothetical protein
LHQVFLKMLVGLLAAATFDSDAAFVGPMTGVAAIRTEAFRSLVITPLGVVNATMAIVPIVGLGSGGAGEQKESTESDSSECGLTKGGAKNGLHDGLLERQPDWNGLPSLED